MLYCLPNILGGLLETWERVDGFGYEVSNLGHVRRICRGRGAKLGRVLKPHPNGRYGYLSVCLYLGNHPTRKYIHHLVAETFIGERPTGKQVDHIDGNVQNNQAMNLRYCTAKENGEGTANRGSLKGERNGAARLTVADIQMIRTRAEHETQRSIARAFGISYQHVSDIVLGKRWGWVKL